MSLLNILSMNGNIDVERELKDFLSRPKNAESLCIIFDGLDEYPPAYSDPSNYIYKIIVRQQLSTATVIVLSRSEAYESFFKTSGSSGFQAYELTGFNDDGIIEYASRNIYNLEHTNRFLLYLIEEPAIHQLCTSPLHLTMFVESFKVKKDVPLTLTEAYIKSLSKSFRREVTKQKSATSNCSHIQLHDLRSLRECNQALADTIVNVSRLAFDSLAAFDRNLTFCGSRFKVAQTQFSLRDLHSYLPFGDAYGLLSSRYLLSHEYEMQPVTELTFPHFVIQEFWAAFIANKSITNFKQHNLFAYQNYLYFACGMYSSNITILRQIFEFLFQGNRGSGMLDIATKCAVESGHIDLFADTYLKLHEATLVVNHLIPFSSLHLEVQYFVHIIHFNLTQLNITQQSPSLRLYVETISDPFPNSATIAVTITNATDNKYPDDFRDNLLLISSWQIKEAYQSYCCQCQCIHWLTRSSWICSLQVLQVK